MRACSFTPNRTILELKLKKNPTPHLVYGRSQSNHTGIET